MIVFLHWLPLPFWSAPSLLCFPPPTCVFSSSGLVLPLCLGFHLAFWLAFLRRLCVNLDEVARLAAAVVHSQVRFFCLLDDTDCCVPLLLSSAASLASPSLRHTSPLLSLASCFGSSFRSCLNISRFIVFFFIILGFVITISSSFDLPASGL